MKTAISVPDEDFERFERLARRHGMNRSEFYRRAAQQLADDLENNVELTRLANSAIDHAGEPVDDLPLRESERLHRQSTAW